MEFVFEVDTLYLCCSQNAKRLAQLVSYHDDTIVSDEEGEGGGGPDNFMDIEEEGNGDQDDNEASVEELEEPTLDGVKLPPEPSGHCSMALQEKIKKVHEMKTTVGFDMNKVQCLLVSYY